MTKARLFNVHRLYRYHSFIVDRSLWSAEVQIIFFLPNYVLWAVRHRADRLCSPFGVLFSVFFLLLFHSWLLNHDPKRIFNNVKLIFIRLKLASCQTKTYLVLKGPNTTKRFLLRFSEATRLCAFQYIYSSLNFTHN